MFWHMNPRELQAASLVPEIFSSSQINQLLHIQLQIDNQVAILYVNHMGGHTLETSMPIKSGTLEVVSLKTNPYLFKLHSRPLNKHADHLSKVKVNFRVKVESYSVKAKASCSLWDTVNGFVYNKSERSA